MLLSISKEAQQATSIPKIWKRNVKDQMICRRIKSDFGTNINFEKIDILKITLLVF